MLNVTKPSLLRRRLKFHLIYLDIIVTAMRILSSGERACLWTVCLRVYVCVCVRAMCACVSNV